MKVLTFTSLYPNRTQHNYGRFVADRMRTWANKYAESWAVASPVPYFPGLPVKTPWKKYALIPKHEIQDGCTVLHPRYFMMPRVGYLFQGDSMAAMAMPAIRRLWNESGPFDLIDAHFVYPDGYSAVKIGRCLGIPVVVTARGSDINLYSDMGRIYPKLIHVLSNADALIGVSNALINKMRALGAPEDRLKHIPNGIDLESFKPGDARGRTRNGSKLLTVGNLVTGKGMDVVIGAFAQVIQDRQNLELTIVGDGPERTALVQLVKTLNLEGHVQFKGALPHSFLPAVFRNSDIFCLGSHMEGCPNVVLEALACGVPVVAAAVGGIPELVKNKNQGILVQPGDRRALAGGILEALSIQWDAWKIRSAVEHLTWDRTADAVQMVFENVLKMRNKNKLYSRDNTGAIERIALSKQ